MATKNKAKNESAYRLLMQLEKDLRYAANALGNAHLSALRIKFFNTAEEILQVRVDICKSIIKLRKQQKKESS